MRSRSLMAASSASFCSCHATLHAVSADGRLHHGVQAPQLRHDQTGGSVCSRIIVTGRHCPANLSVTGLDAWQVGALMSKFQHHGRSDLLFFGATFRSWGKI